MVLKRIPIAASWITSYAHYHDVIHLDVKASNFLLRSNKKNPNRPTLLLADFGIARSSVTIASGCPISFCKNQVGSQKRKTVPLMTLDTESDDVPEWEGCQKGERS